MKYNIMIYTGKAKDLKLDNFIVYDKINKGDKICKENITNQK